MGKYYPTAPKKNNLFKRNVDNKKNVDTGYDTPKKVEKETDLSSTSAKPGFISELLKYLKAKQENGDDQVPSIDEYMNSKEQENITAEDFQVIEEIIEEEAESQVSDEESDFEATNRETEPETETDAVAEDEQTDTTSDDRDGLTTEVSNNEEIAPSDNESDEVESVETELLASDTEESDKEEELPAVVVDDDDDPIEQTKVPVGSAVTDVSKTDEDSEPVAEEETADGETEDSEISDETVDEGKLKQEKYFTRFRICMFAVSALLFILSIVKLYEIYYIGNQAKNSAEQVMDIFEQKLQEIQEGNSAPTITPKPGQTWWPTPKPGTNSTNKPQRAPESDPIAKLAIDKINIKLPVLPYYTEEMLKVSICKYYGGDPNGSGNFVIAGHNYRSGAHFGKLKYLKVGDKVKLTDLSGKTVTYSVYEIITIKPEEPEKLETGLKQSLTMVTCSSNGKLRLVIKCKPDKK